MVNIGKSIIKIYIIENKYYRNKYMYIPFPSPLKLPIPSPYMLFSLNNPSEKLLATYLTFGI